MVGKYFFRTRIECPVCGNEGELFSYKHFAKGRTIPRFGSLRCRRCGTALAARQRWLRKPYVKVVDDPRFK
jgi:C4-type Zn-finger protein